MEKFTLNCDLGEDEPLQLTEQLLSLVDAANISCGYHAGSQQKTRATLELALQYQVKIGVHPGLPTAGGRGQALPTAPQFVQLLKQQLSSFAQIADELDTQAEYVKLHGSLYHGVESQSTLATAFIHFLQQHMPHITVMALANGTFAQVAQTAGLKVWHEAFADRDYFPNGSLVPRSKQGAVLSTRDALERMLIWAKSGQVSTRGGSSIELSADSFCVHGDSPGALELIQQIRNLV